MTIHVTFEKRYFDQACKVLQLLAQQAEGVFEF